MAGTYRNLIAILLSILIPEMLLAASPAAIMYAKGGDVLLNGVLAPESSAIFTGDRMTTTSTAAVNLVLQGSSVVVDPRSTLVYEGTFLDLSAGGASVITCNQMQGRSGGVTVTPSAPVETHYRIAHENGRLLVAALKGSVRVVDHGTETLLAAGNAMSFAEDQPDQNDKRHDKRKDIPPPISPGGVAPGGAILIGAAVAGVAGGAVAIILLTTQGPCQKVSPEGNPYCQ